MSTQHKTIVAVLGALGVALAAFSDTAPTPAMKNWAHLAAGLLVALSAYLAPSPMAAKEEAK